MPLGVLTVDIDKLLKNQVSIPSAQHLHHAPVGSTIKAASTPRPPTRAKLDCFLIKGDVEGKRLWSGVVVPPSPSPTKGTSPRRTKRRSDKLPSKWYDRDDISCNEDGGVEVMWAPEVSFRHTHLKVIDPTKLREPPVVEAIAPAEPPAAVLEGHPPSILSRPGSGVAQKPSRMTSAGRHGSARLVRLTEAHDGLPPSCPPPPLHDSRTTNQLANQPAKDMDAIIHDMGRDIVASSTQYVKERIHDLIHPPAPPPLARRVTSGFRDEEAERRLMSRGGCSCSASPRQRRTGEEMIATCHSVRSTDVRREHEHRLSIDVMRQGCLTQPYCSAHPSSLRTFQPRLLTKDDPMWSEIFDMEYVKPPRSIRRQQCTAARRSESFDHLTPSSQRVVALLQGDRSS